MEANKECRDQQENQQVSELSSSSHHLKSEASQNLFQSVDDLNKLEEETKAFLESSTPFSPSQVNVVSLSKEKIVIEVQVS